MQQTTDKGCIMYCISYLIIYMFSTQNISKRSYYNSYRVFKTNYHASKVYTSINLNMDKSTYKRNIIPISVLC